jgi:hypothetical protein
MTNTTTTKRPNRYAAPCNACGLTVPAGEGVLLRKEGNRWLVGHAPCPGMIEPMGAPVLRTRCSGDVHGPGDDECRGARCVQPMRRTPIMHRYVGMTWSEVREANEFFDGERDAEAAAHQEWVIANARMILDAKYVPFLDTRTPWGDPEEAAMHAMEAHYDRHHG